MKKSLKSLESLVFENEITTNDAGIIKGKRNYKIFGKEQTIYYGRLYSILYKPTVEYPLINSYTARDCAVLVFPTTSEDSLLLVHTSGWHKMVSVVEGDEFELKLEEGLTPIVNIRR